jgi:type VI secretion system protein ImpM
MNENEETSGPRVGFVGKLPAQADFVRQHVADRVGGEFDRWLVKGTQNMLSAKAELPTGAVRFVFSAAQCDSVAVGVLIASRDQVGRSFPLAIYTALPAPLAARHALGLPLAFLQFLDDAEVLASEAATLSAADLRARTAELVPPHQDIVLAASQQSRDVLGQTPAPQMLERVFPSQQVGAPFYGLHTFVVASDGARSMPVSAPPTVLDCPIVTDVDLAAWIDLGRRGCPVAPGSTGAICPTFAWVQVSPRLLLVLGYAPEQLLHFVADPKHKSSRLWPLTTERPEAVERAREVLSSRLGAQPGAAAAASALNTNIETLWNMLSPMKS